MRTKSASALTATDVLAHFNRVLEVDFKAPADLIKSADQAIAGCGGTAMYPEPERERHLIALVNAKLKLNKSRLQKFLDAAARGRVFPNYHDKAEVSTCLDYRDRAGFERWLTASGYGAHLARHFNPVTVAESLAALHDLLRTGTINRSDARDCPVSERQTELLRSLFGSYVFHAFPTEAMHRHFNPDCRTAYHADFYQHLLAFHPESLHRDCALVYLRVTADTARRLTGNKLRDALYGFVARTYDRLSNHCVFAILVEPFAEGGEDGQWRLFSDLVLFAEKHREVPVKTGYFRPDEIRKATAAHVTGLDEPACRFELANEGFFFRDCIILTGQDPAGPGSILIVFDKNERDETVIPCPGCRSSDVAGNSYPALGVRSWECRNPLCPDRSAFDRGNRYSLASIIRQEAIRSEEDQIPDESLRRWKLDVVSGVGEADVEDMLVRHYSFHGDTVVFAGGRGPAGELHGRRVLYEAFDARGAAAGAYKRFQGSPLFSRFVVDRPRPTGPTPTPVPHKVRDAVLYNGDCFDVLFRLPPGVVNGAVTSPPYFNARSYSTWPNIYCYLYDMYNAAAAVYRALRPGGYYVFNIFDYFDNENSVVFSAMGKKRMILGAYVVNLFRRAGFELAGNVAWYKGEIEGKRNYNQGNRSPYYQAPLNCWEHCFVFRKPGDGRRYTFPRVLDAKPVFKMVRGENVLGHTAPFPAAIPLLLVSQMEPGECVLDPYAGSMTTARVATQLGRRSLSVEQLLAYCELGIRLLVREHPTGANAVSRRPAVQQSLC